MFILNLKAAKHFERTPLSAYHSNSDTTHLQWPFLSQENWKSSTSFLCYNKK